MSLNQLVASAKSAEPEAQQVTEELKVIIKKLKKIGEETSKLVSSSRLSLLNTVNSVMRSFIDF